METCPRSFVLLLILAAVASAAHGQATSTTLNSNAILGFETPLGWVSKSSTSSMITVSSTTRRTQGSFAYNVMNPGNLVTMTSAPVSSTATALAGVGNPGALFQVDVLLPNVVGNVNNAGQMQMYVNSPSRGLSKVFVGVVLFSSFRPGIYNTLKFPIPPAVGTALGGVSFTDLTFIFMVSSPGQLTGPYLFDNLRVHSVQLVTANASTKPPAGYGGSVDFVVFGGTPVSQSFNVGVIQVPDSFHLKLGTAGTTTIQLELGYEGTPSFTCMYSPDATDTTGKTYKFTSCTGSMQAGDLVGADWANLAIAGGDNTMKLRAQLAENPMGDLTGGGLLPAMPTFWGDFDGCMPAIVAAGVSPPFTAPSTSCINQTTQANHIVTNYFNEVNNGGVAPNWIVTAKPEFARRHGDGSPHNNLTGPPPPNDPDFDEEGHLNPGGDFDAYYRISGNLGYNADTTADTTDFTVTLAGHAVVFGEDVTVLSTTASLTTTTPPLGGSGSGTGDVQSYLFGLNLPGSGSCISGTTINCPFDLVDQHYDLPPIPVWLFSITPGLVVSIGADLTGGLASDNFNISLTPNIGVGVHMEGGTLPIYGISGGVDAQVDLLDVNGNMGATAQWGFNSEPTQCTANLNASIDGNVDVTAGGGQVDLVVTFGFCPLCRDASWTLFSWKPLLDSGSVPLFDIPVIKQSFELPDPQKMCSPSLNVSFTPPSGPVPMGFPVLLSAQAGVDSVSVPCSSSPPGRTWSWASSMPGDNAYLPSGCSGNVTFPSTAGTGPRNITVAATDTVKDSSGTPIQLKGTSSPQTLTVNQLSPGVYIQQIVLPNNVVSYNGNGYFCPGSLAGVTPTPCTFIYNFAIPQQDMYGSCLGCNFVLPLDVVGQIIGATGTTSTTWTVVDTTTNTTTTPLANDPSNPLSTLVWTPPNLNDTYSITMTTTVAGSFLGTITITVNFFAPPH